MDRQAAPAAPAARALRVGPAAEGLRLDAFLAAQLGIARARARRLLARGAVRVAGRRVTERAKGRALRAGDLVEVAAFAPPGALRPRPQPELPLRILAEGPGWVAVDKPAGVAVHPLEEDETGTLLNALVARFPQIAELGEGGLRGGVVHRLDVGTSGVLLFATAEESWRRLRAAFREHRVEKLYRAVVLGSVRAGGPVEVGLVTARHRPARVRVVPLERVGLDPGVRRARLSWQTRQELRGATLVEVRLETGFQHQIRATLAHLGHPVAGDALYGPGPGADPSGARRPMLHAARVAFEEIAATSPEPTDFRALVEMLRNGTSV